jgi:diguanylate cyclase (GGDEF)-like protein
VEAGATRDFRRCLDGRTALVCEYTCVPAGQDCRHLRFHVSPILDGRQAVSGMLVFIEDATRLREAEQSARQSEERYQLLFQSAPVAMIERDASTLRDRLGELTRSGVDDLDAYLDRHPEAVGELMGLVRTVDCNRAFLDLLEIEDKASFLRRFPLTVFGEARREMARSIIHMVHRGVIQSERETDITTLKGRTRRIMARAMVLEGHESNLSRVLISMVDITKRIEAEEALRQSERRFRDMALRDNLTGLYNRRYLYQSLEGLIEKTTREGSHLSVLFMDLDNFKEIVDRHGHLDGSRIIKEVGASIRRRIQDPAYAVAYAGDEFVVVLPGCDTGQAEGVADGILEEIFATDYLADSAAPVRVRASVGVATCPLHAATLNELLAAADHALFEKKRSGKGGIRRWEDRWKGSEGA